MSESEAIEGDGWYSDPTMTDAAEKLLAAAMKLSPEERERLAKQLLDSTEAANDDWANEGNWSPAARERLEAALAKGSAHIAAGRTVDARGFLATLPKRS